MEARSLEVQILAGAAVALLSRAEAAEVLGSPGNNIGPELHLDRCFSCLGSRQPGEAEISESATRKSGGRGWDL